MPDIRLRQQLTPNIVTLTRGEVSTQDITLTAKSGMVLSRMTGSQPALIIAGTGTVAFLSASAGTATETFVGTGTVAFGVTVSGTGTNTMPEVWGGISPEGKYWGPNFFGAKVLRGKVAFPASVSGSGSVYVPSASGGVSTRRPSVFGIGSMSFGGVAAVGVKYGVVGWAEMTMAGVGNITFASASEGASVVESESWLLDLMESDDDEAWAA
jgi:hypothetical protein